MFDFLWTIFVLVSVFGFFHIVDALVFDSDWRERNDFPEDGVARDDPLNADR